MTPPDGLFRHDWVWLKRGWDRHLRTPLDKIARTEVGTWLDGGRPLVVTRRLPDDQPGDIRLGLALPGRRRIALHMAGQAIARHASPPGLRDVLTTAPLVWRDKLEWLAALTGALGVPTGVYGSLAWQHFACDGNMVYLTSGSDLDLVFRPSDLGSLERLLRELTACEAREQTPRLDGEIVLPDTSAVAWRELAALPEKLMTKSMDAVEMRPLAAIMALFQRRAA
ncbi:Phosphoribosyl-dephospho-CoA transferase [Paramagnetospirillum magnetotacticum MS-1]|uniref:Phosphoribosyl-dephospho-CoA transferase n=1 Tax=Paramagnetospirillum magnetotacticum MS-1 TaxID=272627 RepID=A0A0C2YNM6_PARME|nr:malonate decarboxylase holo-[acyl-carrier-protein] synthase [Paramagnetospirillum magnetotacticum]KIL96713.1 Phosphoribosyl-dephospho-CoA transferase [Paramagnetospirillum magnetotacticum MS-1]